MVTVLLGLCQDSEMEIEGHVKGQQSHPQLLPAHPASAQTQLGQARVRPTAASDVRAKVLNSLCKRRC